MLYYENMKRESKKTVSKTSNQVKFKFDKKDDVIFESTVTSPKGKTNKLQFIFNKNKPDINTLQWDEICNNY